MLDGWSDELSATVRRIQLEFPNRGQSSEMALEAARKTQGLPVYCDIGGCLILMSDGRVLQYASIDGGIAEVTDRQWLLRARVAAAKAFPELGVLVP